MHIKKNKNKTNKTIYFNYLIMSEEKNLPELSKDSQKILELVEKLSVLELSYLIKNMEDKFGVSAAAAVAAAPAAGGADGGEAAEQTEFTVELVAVGDGKINVIKAVKDVLGVGLKEAKDIVDAAPKAVKEKVSKDEAETIKAKLTEAGATAEIK